jgi:FolB domain-containing protein
MKMLMQLKDFSYLVHLGCSESERAHPQEVRLSFDIEYAIAPQVCFSDSIEEGLCYSQLNDKLTEILEVEHFKTLEYLAFKALNLILAACPPGINVVVRAHKVKPPIRRFTQGVVIELRGNT